MVREKVLAMAVFKKYLWFFIFPVVGVVFSLYSIVHYYAVKYESGGDFICNIDQTFNCDAVATSAYSTLLGVPMGVFGTGYFLSLILLLVVGVAKVKGAKDHFLAYTYMNVAGVVVSAVLASISMFVLQTWCLVCMGVYAVCLLQAVLLVVQRKNFVFKMELASLFRGATSAVVVVVACVAVHSVAKPHPTRELAVDDQSPADEQSLLTQLGVEKHEIPINKSPYSGFGEDYRKGADRGVVQVVEFADFQCPACKRVSGVFAELEREYGDRVLFVFKNYPLDGKCNAGMKGRGGHKLACDIAVLARCAGQFGKFWQFHDLAFANQEGVDAEALKSWAMQVGITAEQYSSCQNSQGILAKVKDDISLGNKIGVKGTPAVYINGKKYHGSFRIEQLRIELDNLLNDALLSTSGK